jgi:hypothetical protein
LRGTGNSSFTVNIFDWHQGWNMVFYLVLSGRFVLAFLPRYQTILIFSLSVPNVIKSLFLVFAAYSQLPNTFNELPDIVEGA